MLTTHISHQSGVFATIGEPTLASHYHPKSIGYLWVHPWCCAFLLQELERGYVDQCPLLATNNFNLRKPRTASMLCCHSLESTQTLCFQQTCAQGLRKSLQMTKTAGVRKKKYIERKCLHLFYSKLGEKKTCYYVKYQFSLILTC